MCGGGTRFGGSAEIPLMADVLIGDSRSGLCFSEAMIGLIPGWGGIARALIKSGIRNATYMAKTGAEVKALQLKAMGIYDEVVSVAFPFPKRDDSGNPDVDRAKYEKDLDEHNERTGLILLPKALEWAMGKGPEVLGLKDAERTIQGTDEAIAEEVNRRKDPYTYSSIWGKPLREAREEIGRLGRPLAPQSVEALDHLFKEYDPASFDEMSFVENEMEADARLYRDPRFRAGLVGTLEQRVADYREA